MKEIYELAEQGIISGEVAEELLDIIADPGAFRGAGDLARIGAAMVSVGKAMNDTAKEIVRPHIVGGVGSDGRIVDRDVMFQWRKDSTAIQVDIPEIRRQLPYVEYPDLYKEVHRNGGITITVTDGAKITASI